MGYAFTFPVFAWLGGCTVGAYVHYPTISNDMLERVSTGERMYNNDATITNSPFKTFVKLQYVTAIISMNIVDAMLLASRYYRFFAFLYWFVGRIATLVMANSSWTKRHVAARWNNKNVLLIYPAVDCAKIKTLPLDNREDIIISIGQYRYSVPPPPCRARFSPCLSYSPEKNHMLQLEAFNIFLKNFKGSNKNSIRLVTIGSVRMHKKGDTKRVERLIERAKELNISVLLTDFFSLTISIDSRGHILLLEPGIGVERCFKG